MRTATVLLLSFALAGIAVPAPAQEHAHPSRAAAGEQGGRYATDAALRKHMQAIRDDVAALGHYEKGHMGANEAARLAGDIESHVRAIIAECKLPPDADAALHRIIAPLMQNAAALKADPANREAISALRQALADYARDFDDPAAPAPRESEED